MRALIGAIVGLLLGVSAAFGQAQPQQLLLHGQGWALPGAYSDMDFVNNRYYHQLPLTVVRTQSNSSLSTAQDLAGNYKTFAANTLRQTNQGLLIEEARTNGVRNNTNAGAVAGLLSSGGALPTNWSVIFNSTGLTNANVTVGTPATAPNGVQYIPITINGTVTGTSTVNIIVESTAGASYGQTWTGSIFDQLVSGTGMRTVSMELDGLNTGSFVAGGTQTAYVPTSTLTRENFSFTLTGATVNQARLQYRFNFNSGDTPNFTINLGWAQLENNPNVLTSVGSATVNAAGSGFTGSSGTMTWSGAGCSTNPVLNVTASGGAITGVTSVATAGACSSFPSSSATTWTAGGGLSGGSGASFNLTPTNNAALGNASSPILTATGSGARVGDYILVTNPQFVPVSPLWMFASFVPVYTGGAAPIAFGTATALSFTNLVQYAAVSTVVSSSSLNCVGCTGGVSQPNTTVTNGVLNKVVGAWYTGGSGLGPHLALNGVMSGGGYTALPTAFLVNFLAIGSAPWNNNANQINAYVNRFAIGFNAQPPSTSKAWTTLSVNN